MLSSAYACIKRKGLVQGQLSGKQKVAGFKRTEHSAWPNLGRQEREEYIHVFGYLVANDFLKRLYHWAFPVLIDLSMS